MNDAEGGGFEPPEAFTSMVFKTIAIVRSAIPPLARLSAFASTPNNIYLRRVQHRARWVELPEGYFSLFPQRPWLIRLVGNRQAQRLVASPGDQSGDEWPWVGTGDPA